MHARPGFQDTVYKCWLPINVLPNTLKDGQARTEQTLQHGPAEPRVLCLDQSFQHFRMFGSFHNKTLGKTNPQKHSADPSSAPPGATVAGPTVPGCTPSLCRTFLSRSSTPWFTWGGGGPRGARAAPQLQCTAHPARTGLRQDGASPLVPVLGRPAGSPARPGKPEWGGF